jgi:hypothetical protein
VTWPPRSHVDSAVRGAPVRWRTRNAHREMKTAGNSTVVIIDAGFAGVVIDPARKPPRRTEPSRGRRPGKARIRRMCVHPWSTTVGISSDVILSEMVPVVRLCHTYSVGWLIISVTVPGQVQPVVCGQAIARPESPPSPYSSIAFGQSRQQCPRSGGRGPDKSR